MTLGKFLRKTRLDKKIMLKTIAEQTNSSNGRIHDIEFDRNKNPSFRIISQIAEILQVTLDEVSKHV